MLGLVDLCFRYQKIKAIQNFIWYRSWIYKNKSYSK